MTATAALRKSAPRVRPPIVDRAALDAELDRIAGLDATIRSAEVKRVLKEALAAGHRLAAEWLSEDGRGHACAWQISLLMDELISALHRYTVTHIHPERPDKAPSERLAVIAVGGYGRGTLAPGSDIDLLFLFPKQQTAWGTAVVEAMLLAQRAVAAARANYIAILRDYDKAQLRLMVLTGCGKR